MSLIPILLTALALSMDAFAVSIIKGIYLKNLTTKVCLKIALFFGLFQGGMPLLGWVLGVNFEDSIKSIDHWISLILLGFLGLKMIYEFIKNRNNHDEKDFTNINSYRTFLYDKVTIDDCSNNNLSISTKDLTMLSIATSIDALAIGINFAFLNVDIVFASSSTCIVTFIMCFIGVKAGKKISYIFKDYAELLGGIILILIGINIFNEHTNFISNLFINIF